MKFKRHAEQWQRLFKYRAGRVDIEIGGPRIGWKKRAVRFCRWRPSTRDPGGFDRIDWFEERDLVHLEKCIKQARLWCKAEDNGTSRDSG